MLHAKSIPYVDGRSGARHVLLVEQRYLDTARRELATYADENVDWPVRHEPARTAPGAKQGTLAFVVAIGAFHLVTAGRVFGLDWHARGAAHAARILDGEPWRATTSLFLHSGPVHVFSNLFFGALFFFCAAFNLGGGVTCLAMLIAGTLGNVTNAWLQDPGHVSIGASTAVFAAVGLLGGSEWRRRRLLAQRRLRVAAPIVMAACILAFHGVPMVPERVDVMAHVTGFAWGVVFGAALPSVLGDRIEDRRTQVVSGILTGVLIALSWSATWMTSA